MRRSSSFVQKRFTTFGREPCKTVKPHTVAIRNSTRERIYMPFPKANLRGLYIQIDSTIFIDTLHLVGHHAH